MKRVFNFSGGKTSAYMVIHYALPDDIILFCDTGREHPATYQFIDDFERHEGIPVTRIAYKNAENAWDQWMQDKNYKILPNRVRRICTTDLKILTAKRYLRSIGIQRFENYIGFRADEERRVKNVRDRAKKVIAKYPLYEDGIVKQEIDEFWKKKPYTLEIPSILGNCTLCFLKGKNAIISILRKYPHLADPWINDEIKSNRTFFPDTNYQQLLNLSKQNLFAEYDLNDTFPAFNCSCTT